MYPHERSKERPQHVPRPLMSNVRLSLAAILYSVRPSMAGCPLSGRCLRCRLGLPAYLVYPARFQATTYLGGPPASLLGLYLVPRCFRVAISSLVNAS